MKKSLDTALIEAFIDTARILRGRGIELCPANVEVLKKLAADENVEWLLGQAYNLEDESSLKVEANRRKKIKDKFLDLVREENPNHPFLQGGPGAA